jgi:CheY-like chemotaxis protein
VSQILLLVDDDAAIVSVVRRYFEGRGFEVEACLDAPSALARAGSGERFDAVVCDLHFTPARLAEGLEVVAQARRASPGAAVLLFTADGDASLHQQALRLGADAVILKPAPLASLHEAVLRAMKKT